MSNIRISSTDEIEAAKAVNALREKNQPGFRQIVDDAFARYGGVERMIFVLASQLSKEDV